MLVSFIYNHFFKLKRYILLISYTILILDDVHPEASEILKKNGFKVLTFPVYDQQKIEDVIGEIDAIIYRSFSTIFGEDLLHKANKLKYIVRTGGGVGRIDLSVTQKLNIVVMHTAGCNSFTASEFAIASILNLARNITTGDRLFHSEKFDRSDLWGTEIVGKTLGIVGFGRIGKNLSKWANNFSMKVISYSPLITEKEENEYNVQSVELDYLYIQSDFISIAYPPKLENKDSINKSKFKLMKKGVRIVNLTWMGIFNLEDLAEALIEQKVAGILFDRPEYPSSLEKNPLEGLTNIIYTPNLGSHTLEGQKACATASANQVLEYIKFKKITNQIK
jgi:D-3-phosphoglycerate dehydrogenase